SISTVRGDVAGLRRQATGLRDMLAARGFAAELIETPRAPLVFGERRTPGGTRTLLLYFHYDGQPVDSPPWKHATPFTPVLRSGRLDDPATREITDFRNLTRFEADWRLYGRASADDKAPIVSFLAALDALQAGPAITWNVKVLMDGEEESGSTGL